MIALLNKQFARFVGKKEACQEHSLSSNQEWNGWREPTWNWSSTQDPTNLLGRAKLLAKAQSAFEIIIWMWITVRMANGSTWWSGFFLQQVWSSWWNTSKIKMISLPSLQLFQCLDVLHSTSWSYFRECYIRGCTNCGHCRGCTNCSCGGCKRGGGFDRGRSPRRRKKSDVCDVIPAYQLIIEMKWTGFKRGTIDGPTTVKNLRIF